MVTTIEDPLVTVRNLLRDKWESGRTRSTTPRFSTGWWDREKRAILPLVTVTSPDEVPRVRGMTATGVAQYRTGQMLVSCWVDRGVTINGTALGTAGAKDFAYELWREVDRIITSNQNDVLDFNHMDVGASGLVVEDDVKPAVYRRQGLVTYSWIKQP